MNQRRATPARALPPGALRHGVSSEILEDRVTAETIDAAFAVHEALGVAHHVDTYRTALAVELNERGLPTHRGATFSVLYRQRVVGNFAADLLVDERVLVQVSAEPHLGPEQTAEGAWPTRRMSVRKLDHAWSASAHADAGVETQSPAGVATSPSRAAAPVVLAAERRAVARSAYRGRRGRRGSPRAWSTRR